MITVSLTEQENNVLIQLIDLAVKSGGLQVAEASVVLSKKLQAAQAAANTPTVVGDASVAE